MNKTDIYKQENKEWLASLDFILQQESPERVKEILQKLQARASKHGIPFTQPGNTPYINTIPEEEESAFPGSLETEQFLENIIRWNSIAMVVRANQKQDGIGGHISSYASAATLFEVAFNHFLRGGENDTVQDIVYYQGHASPGIYARSYVEGRLSEEELDCFRREISSEKGLSSYPHPRLMPGYWRFPTVSMGLSPLQAIYQARFMRYLENRGLKEKDDQKVWAFIGDGEMDEPEAMGSLGVASREKLDNLIMVIDCNLQRLDGPVRGNGKIIQELEAAYKGAGWNVIKVIWGREWDPLLAKDEDGRLVERMGEVVDGELQRYAAEGGAYFREEFFGKDERLLQLVENYSDDELAGLRWGGHDPVKVYNAYRAAVRRQGAPTVVLAQTVKGYGLGEAGEARNITHQKKKLEEDTLRYVRDRFKLPIENEAAERADYFQLEEENEAFQYLKERRKALGGPLPRREAMEEAIEAPGDEVYETFFEGTGDRPVATTMSIVHLMSELMKDEQIGERIIPIVPDESRTFGMDALFSEGGIYSASGQEYKPVDEQSLLSYDESRKGVILEEGITEAGAMGSFIAAGTAHVNYGFDTIPFFLFYSMFGFQRVGDLIWAAADARARGFLIGATSGRSTLPGEGLQHCDGQSQVFALSNPALKAYDPTYAYEVAVIVREGIRRMYVERQDIMYYITVMNEKYIMPPMPEDVEEGILKGMYRLEGNEEQSERVHLLGSGAILREALKAREILEDEYNVPADVWSITGYKQLYDDAKRCERYRILHPGEKPGACYIRQCFTETGDIFVAATDYLKALPLSVAKWFPGDFTALGTDGFGRSDNRAAMRSFFEVDYRHIALTALARLAEKGEIEVETVKKALKELDINPDKTNPGRW